MKLLGALLVTGAMLLTPLAAHAHNESTVAPTGKQLAAAPLAQNDDFAEYLDAEGFWKEIPEALPFDQLLTAEVSNLDTRPVSGGVHVSFDYDRAPKFRQGYYSVLVDGEVHGELFNEFFGPGSYDEFIPLSTGSHTVVVRGWYNTEAGSAWKEFDTHTVDVPAPEASEETRTVRVDGINIGPSERGGGFELGFSYYLAEGVSEGAIRLLINGEPVQPDPMQVTADGRFETFVPGDYGTYDIAIHGLYVSPGQAVWGQEFATTYRFQKPTQEHTLVTPLAAAKAASANVVTVPALGTGYTYATGAGAPLAPGSYTLQVGETLCVVATPLAGYAFPTGSQHEWCFTGAKLAGGQGTDDGTSGGEGPASGDDGQQPAGSADRLNSSAPAKQIDAIAATGSNAGLLVGGALSLLILGGIVTVIGRSRRACPDRSSNAERL